MVLEPAAELAERRTNGRDDHGASHMSVSVACGTDGSGPVSKEPGRRRREPGKLPPYPCLRRSGAWAAALAAYLYPVWGMAVHPWIEGSGGLAEPTSRLARAWHPCGTVPQPSRDRDRRRTPGPGESPPPGDGRAADHPCVDDLEERFRPDGAGVGAVAQSSGLQAPTHRSKRHSGTPPGDPPCRCDLRGMRRRRAHEAGSAG